MNGMTLIVKTITRLLLGFIVVFGAVTVIYGHLTPGGGFSGGVILACAFVLLTLAFGRKAAFEVFNEKLLASWDSFGVVSMIEIVFIGLIGGFAMGQHISHGESFRLMSGGTVMWSNIVVGIKVGVFLFAIFMAFAAFRMNDNREGEG